MPLAHTYTDAYLKTRVTEAIEARATDDIAQLGTFPDAWKNKLIVLRGYLLACLEQGGQAEDTFAVKLAQYRKEFDFTLSLAKAAQAEAAPDTAVPILTIPIERA